MSNFASIKYIQSYDKVTYYSIVIDGGEEEESLFELFVDQYTEEEKEKLNHILSWIKEIGNKYGALDHLFRDENNASALPPRGIDREPTYIEMDSNTANPLRLYCHRLNAHVVFLFGGGVKTTDVVQHCPNVRMPFHLANKLAKLIDQNIIEKEIEWEDDRKDILYDREYKLYY